MVDEVEMQDQHDSDSSSDNFFIGTVETNKPPNEWLETVEINTHKLNVNLTQEPKVMSFLYLHIKN